MNLAELAPDIQELWEDGDYYRATTALKAAIATKAHPLLQHYLGLAYVLQGKEEIAIATWQEKRYPQLSELQDFPELLDVLRIEAAKQEAKEQWLLAQRIRQQIQRLNSQDINNSLQLILLAIRLDSLKPALFEELKVIPVLKSKTFLETDLNLDLSLAFTVTQELLEYSLTWDDTAEFINALVPYISDPQPWLDLVRPKLQELVNQHEKILVCRYADFCLALNRANLELLLQLIPIYESGAFYRKTLELAEQFIQQSQTLLGQILGNVFRLSSSMWMLGNWDAVSQYRDQQLELLEILFSDYNYNPEELFHPGMIARSLFFLPYFSDRPSEHHHLRQKVGNFYQDTLHAYLQHQKQQSSEVYQPYPELTKQGDLAPQRKKIGARKLRVGYLGHYLQRQSVGWLSRWLFANHDHDQFEIYTYFNQQTVLQEFSQQCFAEKSDVWRATDEDILSIAQTIQADEIDVLVEVDSVTCGETYGVMALKPAPIQVSWLGWDATGLSTIDYIMADPYVLPEDAQDYYVEKIWRLPDTYIAVSGFEVEVANYRREQLDIPSDAVVYLNNQTPHKLHPDFVPVQLQILREVPNSYLLVKRWWERDTMESFWGDLAESIGVSRDRLRFLPVAPSEPVYRANLSLVDIVLDCYPYNGATTTLETLWMGIPVVTKVGEQFQARNSYTMMMNAGITEGIAWSDDEYIDWAVRLGTNEGLRKQVFTKLMRSRQTAPLWNAKQFTRDMEAAYQQMWRLYQE
jgi:predicted O-linked N-acetylglucosamine transferase (SPINDLY family)